jgi:3-hydroxymyristoyl/3-hydroxydecanoyl-(acyl carrier protein) dehydratase
MESKTQIEILPHRLEVDQSRGRLRAELKVPADFRFFSGHFPGRPILPGVAQLSEIVLPLVEANWPSLGCLSSIKRLKFKELILPDDELELTLQVEAQTVRFWLKRDGQDCAVGALAFSVV